MVFHTFDIKIKLNFQNLSVTEMELMVSHFHEGNLPVFWRMQTSIQEID
jgi:hypothetical protein